MVCGLSVMSGLHDLSIRAGLLHGFFRDILDDCMVSLGCPGRLHCLHLCPGRLHCLYVMFWMTALSVHGVM
jgi:hypothetical protein